MSIPELTLHDLNTDKELDLTSDTSTLMERGSYKLEYVGPNPVELLLTDAVLEPRTSYFQDGVYRRTWMIVLYDYAGSADLNLLHDSELVWGRSFQVHPMDSKLQPEHYRQMLDDLNHKAQSTLQGLGNTFHSFESSYEEDIPWISQMVAIRLYGYQMLQMMRVITDQPQQLLISCQKQVLLHSVRQVSGSTLQMLARNPVVLGARKGRPVRETVPNVLVDVRRQTAETPVNRFVKYVLLQILKTAQEVVRQLVKAKGKASRDRDLQKSNRLVLWENELKDFLYKLERLNRQPLWSGLRPESAGASALLSLRGHPTYARWYRLATAILRPAYQVVDAEASVQITAPATYELYEKWVLFRLADLLEEVYPELRWSWEGWTVRNGMITAEESQLCFKGVSTELQVRLMYQNTYKSHKLDHKFVGNLLSISKELRPDFILQVKQGTRVQHVILDAKYRTSRESVHDALRDIHVYRDALRVNPAQQVDGAFVLTPGIQSNADLYFTEHYRAKFAFGGFILCPGDTGREAEFKSWLKRLLEE